MALPEGWRTATLKEIATRVQRVGREAPDVVAMITSRDGFVQQHQKYNKYMAGESLDKYVELQHGESAYNRGNSKTYPYGCVFRMTKWPSAAVPYVYICFALTSESVDGGFLEHALRAGVLNEQLRRVITSTARSNGLLNIDRDDFFSCTVLLPPLPEQRKIAAILSSVDETIEKTEAVIEQLQVVKKAMMEELLTRGMPGRHTRFKQTEIGEVPEGWAIVDIATLVHSCDYGLSVALGANDAHVPVLRMGNLVDGELDFGSLKYVEGSDAVPDDLLLHPGELLFNRTNSLALVGKVALFRGADRPTSFASYLLRLRPRRELVDSAWLNDVLNAPVNQARIQSLAQPGVSQANINRGRFLELEIALPCLEEQREIAVSMEMFRVRLGAERRHLDAARQVKAALSAALLTGDLRVTPDEASP